ncbi:MAG: HRDC domain-containing protein [Bacteroidales bacterium]|nr:HRDC domain-containing protein [Bacteroidales bacterium]
MSTNTFYIDSATKAAKVYHLLSGSKEISVDLEFDNNLHHYGFKLCLMQIGLKNDAYVLDPYYIDIQQFFGILENESIRKTVFSFGEDLRLLHSMGCFPRNLFDISMAAKFLNYEKISLADVVFSHLGITIEKNQQISDWCSRPLKTQQIDYAAGDVIWLDDLRNGFMELLRSKNMLSWMEEENIKMSESDFSQLIYNKLSTKLLRNLNQIEGHYLEGFWNFREEIAAEYDKPAYQIISNNVLTEMAQNPQMLKSFSQLKGVFHGLKNEFYQQKFNELYQKLNNEIRLLKLSSQLPAIKKLGADEYKQMRLKKMEAEKTKEILLKPIQNLIRRDFGEFAVNYIFSNRIMDEIALNDRTNWRNYRKELIIKYSAELNLETELYQIQL